MASPNIAPRQEQDLPDDALSIVEMLEGKLLEYSNGEFAQQGKTETTEFDGFFKSIEYKGELAKQIVIFNEIEQFIKSLPPDTPEGRLVAIIDDIMLKCGWDAEEKESIYGQDVIKMKGEAFSDNDMVDTQKTNLPPAGKQSEGENFYESDNDVKTGRDADDKDGDGKKDNLSKSEDDKKKDKDKGVLDTDANDADAD